MPQLLLLGCLFNPQTKTTKNLSYTNKMINSRANKVSERKELTESAEVKIFVAGNSSYSCLPSTMLMMPDHKE